MPSATRRCPARSSPYHSHKLALVVNIVVHIKLKNTIIWNLCAGGSLFSGFLFEFIIIEYQEYMSVIPCAVVCGIRVKSVYGSQEYKGSVIRLIFCGIYPVRFAIICDLRDEWSRHYSCFSWTIRRLYD